MPRARTGTVRRKRHKKILKANKGYYGARHRLFRVANQAFLRAGEHQFAGRKLRKRDMKSLWIIRINAILSQMGVNYSTFTHDLKKKNIKLNTKVIAEIATTYPEAFKELFKKTSSIHADKSA